MSSKFQTALLIGIAFVVVMLYMRRPEKQIPIVQNIEVTQTEKGSITVEGASRITAVLDTAEFTIAFDIEDDDLEVAKEKSEEMHANLIKTLVDSGIDENDIVPGYLRVQAKTGYTTNFNNMPYGRYVVHRTAKVILYNLEELEPLFISLQEAGFYDIKDIVLSTSNIDDVRNRVNQLAIDAANQRAKAIARAINLEIGQVISIDTSETDYSNTSSSSYKKTYQSLDDFFGVSNNGWRADSYSGPEIIIVAEVTVKYELK